MTTLTPALINPIEFSYLPNLQALIAGVQAIVGGVHLVQGSDLAEIGSRHRFSAATGTFGNSGAFVPLANGQDYGIYSATETFRPVALFTNEGPTPALLSRDAGAVPNGAGQISGGATLQVGDSILWSNVNPLGLSAPVSPANAVNRQSPAPAIATPSLLVSTPTQAPAWPAWGIGGGTTIALSVAMVSVQAS